MREKDFKIKDLCLMGILLSLIIIGSYTKIPLPYGGYLSLQFFFVMLTGLLLSPSKAFLTLLIYLIIGLCGLPVFAGGGGISYIMKPTYGFLISFLISAPVISYISKSDEKRNIIACLIGLLITYVIGITYEYYILIYALHTKIKFSFLIIQAITTFMPKDVLTIFIAVAIKKRLIQ